MINPASGPAPSALPPEPPPGSNVYNVSKLTLGTVDTSKIVPSPKSPPL